jgi:hypothetical protein
MATEGLEPDWPAVIWAGQLQPAQRASYWRAAADAAPAAVHVLRSAAEFDLLAGNAQLASEEDEKTIAKDIRRSRLGASGGPGNEGELQQGEGEQLAMQQLLRVYAVTDPEVGYCQGMNFVAALCLHVLPRPYEAYRLFTALLHQSGLGLRALYLRGFHMAMSIMHAVERALYLRKPAVVTRLAAHGGGVGQMCLPWVITLAAASFPVGAALAAWDLLLHGLFDPLTAPQPRVVLAAVCVTVVETAAHNLATANIEQSIGFSTAINASLTTEGDAGGEPPFCTAARQLLGAPTECVELIQGCAAYDADAAGRPAGFEKADAAAETVAATGAAAQRRRALEEAQFGAGAMAELESAMGSGDPAALKAIVSRLNHALKEAEPEPAASSMAPNLLSFEAIPGSGGAMHSGTGGADELLGDWTAVTASPQAAAAESQDGWALLREPAFGLAPRSAMAAGRGLDAAGILDEFFASWTIVTPRADEGGGGAAGPDEALGSARSAEVGADFVDLFAVSAAAGSFSSVGSVTLVSDAGGSVLGGDRPAADGLDGMGSAAAAAAPSAALREWGAGAAAIDAGFFMEPSPQPAAPTGRAAAASFGGLDPLNR